MAARKADPQSRYRVMAHKANGYVYAATCETVVDEGGKKGRRYTHWGALEDGRTFVPNLRYLALSAQERERLVFPADWDISKVGSCAPMAGEVGDPAEPTVVENKLYGDVWLLVEIAKLTGVTHDLMVALSHQTELVDDVLSLAACHCLTGRDLLRLPTWQRSVRLPSVHELCPERVERLMRSIDHGQVMEFFSLRCARQPVGPRYACVTATPVGEHLHATGLRRPRSEALCRLGRDRVVEVVVRSLATHEPLYCRAFREEAFDVDAAVSLVEGEISELGMADGCDVFVACDLGRRSMCDVGALIDAGIPFVAGVELTDGPLTRALASIAWDARGLPLAMDYDADEGIWHTQIPLESPSLDTADAGIATMRSDGLVLDVFLDMCERVAELSRLKALTAVGGRGLKDTPGDESSGACVGTAALEEVPEGFASAEVASGFRVALAYRVSGTAIDHLRVLRVRDEQERHFERVGNQVGLGTRVRPHGPGEAGRLLCAFVASILASVVRQNWELSAELRCTFASPEDVLDEMRDIRWCGYQDGTGRMTSFSATQEMVAVAFGIEVPRDCVAATGHGRYVPMEKMEPGATLGRRRGPARNRV